MNQPKPAGVQSPAERQGIATVLACFLCIVYLFKFATPTVAWLHSWWAGWLIYVAIPLVLTFTLLHGSRIHREMSEAGRDAFLFLMSVTILVGVVIFMTLVAVSASVFTGIARIGP